MSVYKVSTSSAVDYEVEASEAIQHNGYWSFKEADGSIVFSIKESLTDTVLKLPEETQAP